MGNENVILCPSIESLEGLKNVDAIAAVEGIDMLAYGHSDLSGAPGIHLQLDHPRFKDVVRTIAESVGNIKAPYRATPEQRARLGLRRPAAPLVQTAPFCCAARG
jgi:2-keto-3-deoxy-L-rhamnonate aldolase RhmA